ncbi:MAG: (d)CMP kinase [Persephonella sp.]|nr:(d)CMP kinase [Persephonella sp.]
MIIAIDGPAGCGKSTIAKMIAKELGFTYIDTGAMYRAVALKLKRKNINPEDVRAVLKVMENTDIQLKPAESGVRVFLDGEDVSDQIRTEEIGRIASQIARYPQVRRILVRMQRFLGEKTEKCCHRRKRYWHSYFPRCRYKNISDSFS